MVDHDREVGAVGDAPTSELTGEFAGEGIALSDLEAEALALRVVTDWCRHGEQPEWEDLPLLGEFAFGRLCEAMVRVADVVEAEAERRDVMHGIDSAALLREARDA